MSLDELRGLAIPENPRGEGGRIPFRMRIGVTGHRDPVQSEELSATLRAGLVEISERFPRTEATLVVFEIISALADGADRIVVQEAINLLKKPGVDVELHAVLPLKADDYRESFDADISRLEFEELLAGAAVCTEMPRTRDRDEAYESAGRYIADHSDVVIALWDGQEPSGRGGTAEIVGYARRRGVPMLVVATSRQGSPDRAPQHALGGVEQVGKVKLASEVFDRLEEYNQRSVQDPGLERKLEVEEARLGPAVEDTPIHWIYEIVAAWALPHFVRADSLARKYQRWYYASGTALYGLAALAVTAVAAQWLFRGPSWVAALEIVFMLGVVGIYASAHSRGIHDRWLGYRSLAEAFRSALFITVTGALNRLAGDDPRGLVEVGEAWYQRAFSEAWKRRPSIPVHRSSARGLASFLVEAWIEEQIRYHDQTVKKFGRERKAFNLAVFLLFATTIVVACLHASGVAGDSPTLVFLAIILPSFGAALTGVRDLHQYRVHEDRSKRTAEHLERLKSELASHAGLRAVQKLAAETQALVERETLDWSGVIEFQELELTI
jgi:hypothetical protein